MGKKSNGGGGGEEATNLLPPVARAAIFVAGIFISYRQRKRAKQEAERQRRLAARREVSFGDNDSAGIVLYGRTAYRPQPVYYGAHANFTRPTDLDDGTFLGNLPSRDGRTNEFLMIETVPSVGELNQLIRVIGTENEINTSLHFHLMTHGGAPTAFTNRYRVRDAATAKYSFWTRIQSIYRHDVDRPVFGSAPVVMFEVEGVQTPNITKDGTNPAIIEENRSYNRDIASVWLDFLTRPRVNNRPEYGPGLSYNQLDLESFYRAKTIASAEVETGHLRHMFNGSLSTEEDQEQIFETLRTIAPGTQLFRAWDTGLWKLVLPHASNRTNAVFNERNIVGDVEIIRPGTNDRLNSITVSYTSARQDFTENTITYPTPGSTFSNQLLSQDNNTHLSTSISLPGVTSAKQANSVAFMLLQRSRREQITWESKIDGALTEPGDIVTVSLDAQNIEYEVLVQQIEIFDDFSVRLSGVRWIDNDYNYITTDDEELIPTNVVDRSFVRPASVSLTDLPQRRQIQVSVTLPDNTEQDAAAPFYEYQVEIDGIFRTWITTAATSVLYDVPLLLSNNYRFRARATNGQTRHSLWRESIDTINYQAYQAISGEDFGGIETIFSITNTNNPPPAPNNSWGFDQPQAPWNDGATAAAPGQYTWRSERAYSGDPATGDQIDNEWGPVQLFSYFSLDGSTGATGATGPRGIQGPSGPAGLRGVDGTPGDDGQFIEWIFAKTLASVTSVSTPLNSWDYDEPGTRNGVQWFDAAPSLVPGEVLWLSTRIIPAGLSAGDDVPNNSLYYWSIPAIVGRNSLDGEDGDPGLKTEYCYTVSGRLLTSFSSSQLPRNSWPYTGDSAVMRFASTRQWRFDNFNPTFNLPSGWRSSRQVPADLEVGDSVPNNSRYYWNTPVVWTTSPVIPLSMTCPITNFYIFQANGLSETVPVRVVGGSNYVDLVQNVWVFVPAGFNPIGTPPFFQIGGRQVRATGSTGTLPAGFSVSNVSFSGAIDGYIRFRLTYTSGTQSASLDFVVANLGASG